MTAKKKVHWTQRPGGRKKASEAQKAAWKKKKTGIVTNGSLPTTSKSSEPPSDTRAILKSLRTKRAKIDAAIKAIEELR